MVDNTDVNNEDNIFLALVTATAAATATDIAICFYVLANDVVFRFLLLLILRLLLPMKGYILFSILVLVSVLAVVVSLLLLVVENVLH